MMTAASLATPAPSATPAVPRPFLIRVRHDTGATNFEYFGSDTARGAVAGLLNSEHAPLSAVVWVKYRPFCRHCDRLAARYVRDSGQTPLCAGHARERYGTVRRARQHTGHLGVTRFTEAPRATWA